MEKLTRELDSDQVRTDFDLHISHERLTLLTPIILKTTNRMQATGCVLILHAEIMSILRMRLAKSAEPENLMKVHSIMLDIPQPHIQAVLELVLLLEAGLVIGLAQILSAEISCIPSTPTVENVALRNQTKVNTGLLLPLLIGCARTRFAEA